jgi:hypothetical protein
VGGKLKVWSGALLLADFILHNSFKFQNCTALELGAGTGRNFATPFYHDYRHYLLLLLEELYDHSLLIQLLHYYFIRGFVGIVLSRVAKRVYITDYDVDVLRNCAHNVRLNEHLFRNQHQDYNVAMVPFVI